MVGERGYTIVEVMIFLAISGGMFFAAMILINGQQDKIRFSQAMRDLDSKVQDIINDVSTGYFPTSKEIKCSEDPNPAAKLLNVIANPTPNNDVGQNEQCILLGKVLHFSPGNERSKLNVYSVVGLRANKSVSYAGETYKQQVVNLADAKPTALIDNYDITESSELQWGIKLKGMTPIEAPMIGVYTSLGGSELSGVDTTDKAKKDVSYKLKSGSQNAQAIDFGTRLGFSGPSFSTQKSEATDIISRQAGFGYGLTQAYSLCFESSNGDQTAVLTIGQSGRSISTKLEFTSC